MDQFNVYFATLYHGSTVDCDRLDLKDIRYWTIRALDSLGHVEFDFDQRYVSSCHPALVALPQAGTPRTIITGARTQGLLNKVLTFQKAHREDISVLSIPQFINTAISKTQDKTSFKLPSAVVIEASGVGLLNSLVEEAGIKIFVQESPSPVLAEFSADIKEIRDSLIIEITAAPSWPSRTFVPEKLSFSKDNIPGDESTLTTYASPIDQRRLHIYWYGRQGAKVDRDWGRYLILSDKKTSVLLYDSRRQELAVPATVPLPRLLSRAATLCSGRVPYQFSLGDRWVGGVPPQHPMDVYTAVPPKIAQTIAEKLGQRLQDYRIENASYGE